jgi:hypothetical protein
MIGPDAALAHAGNSPQFLSVSRGIDRRRESRFGAFPSAECALHNV